MERNITIMPAFGRVISADDVRRLYDGAGWWPGWDRAEIGRAVEASVAVGAWDGQRLVGFARAISDGDQIRVYNDLGEVHCEANVTPEPRPGTVSLPKGLWARSTLNGATANALVPDSLTDLAGGACFNDARVQVELLGRH